MSAYNRNHFTSKADAVSRRKGKHVCLSCLHNQNENWGDKECPSCKEKKTRKFFGSTIEFKRGMELLLQNNIGQISHLQFQKRFDLIVNEKKVTTYVCDSIYQMPANTGRWIVEDVKPDRFMTAEAKVKIALFDAIHSKIGLCVTKHRVRS